MRYRRAAILLVVCFATAAGCGSDQTGSEGNQIDCSADEYYDQVNDRCVPRMQKDPEDTDPSPKLDTGIQDVDPSEDTTSDTSTPDDTSEETDTLPAYCDSDNDRALDESCGGNDCDDDDPSRAPNLPERCDNIDNDCDGEVNEEIDCSFYAHEDEALYKINPFALEATEVGANLPGLHDLDTHPDGTLYGVTPQGFYRFDAENQEWTELRSFPQNASWAPSRPDGLAIDRRGTIFVTSKNTLYTITPPDQNPDGDQWWVEAVGTMGETDSGTAYNSSGDAVVYKKSLWMSSDHADDQDYLVSLNPTDGAASNPRPLGYDSVFGLTTAWGDLYGVTQEGELIAIEPTTGESELLHTFDHEWFGAASTPRRDRRGK